MGFKFGNLRRPPVSVEYLPHESVKPGEGLQVELNLDLLTLELMESLDEEMQKTIEDIQTELDGSDETPPVTDADAPAENKKPAATKFEMFHFEKMNVRFKARMLGGNPGENNPDKRFVRGWNMTDDEGKEIPVSYEIFEAMPKTALDSFYNFVTAEAGKPTKKSAAE